MSIFGKMTQKREFLIDKLCKLYYTNSIVICIKPTLYNYIGGIVMTSVEKILLNNPNTDDKILALMAEIAIKRKDEELLEKIVVHPNAGCKTFKIIG